MVMCTQNSFRVLTERDSAYGSPRRRKLLPMGHMGMNGEVTSMDRQA